MNKDEESRVQEIMNEKGQNAVNEIVKKEKNRISKLKEKVNSKKEIRIKEYLIDSPNPNQKRIDKIIEEEKER
jgi:hypothetical protein